MFRESEGYSDTHGDETGHSDPKLLSPPASMHMVQQQRVSNHSVIAHEENGFKSREMDEEEEDWASGSRPSFHLTLAGGATDESEKVEPQEDFFVPLDVKEADIIMKSSKSPPVDKVINYFPGLHISEARFWLNIHKFKTTCMWKGLGFLFHKFVCPMVLSNEINLDLLL